ncbi:hypothetical protein SAMN05445504_9281 [Burkholderia sp. CF099]|nr:hypothetical protein SAMN05445504_9281 [Burkholderia sp. CF099]
MKKLVQALVTLAMLSNVGTAFAQSDAGQIQGGPVAATQLSVTSNGDDGWRISPAPEKLAAQVQQERVHAKQSGQIDYLNRTLYAHH